MDLQSIVQAVRGQHHGDFRPNKAMCPARLNQLLSGYKHKELLVQVAQSDIPATWKKYNPLQTRALKNHRSASQYLNAVVRAVRKGQDAGQYLVFDIKVLEIWNDNQISPLGEVEKKDCDPEQEVRLIHDLSCPQGRSTNAASKTEDAP
ncbi:hypothetical protein PC116_g14432 [Phytophthora cactorum]|nr:hypothetical protein Pcac1_g16446 [Phytophthora cactorum]KAG3165075.1 hypothetical protein C6341_g12501 [Phytophthora cactorum]KAG4237520.1 hypothetical protein PC116_g14432 [Phytophthora cactorum]